MADATRKPMFDRLSALMAGPFLLGRKALSLDWAQAEGGPPAEPPETPARITVKSPEHAIMRRG